MKAIILAAGQGTRLDRYAKHLPKSMLTFAGKTLLERQIAVLRSVGISDISVVTGYKSDKIKYKGVKYYKNKDYRSTNMVESLFCAKEELIDDSIIAYGDIIYEREVLKNLIKTSHEISVAIDEEWQKYWQIRYGTLNSDLESLVIDSEGSIKELGEENVRLEKISGRYIGLIKFSKRGLDHLKETYNHGKNLFWDKPWKTSGKIFQKAFMTDILQALIDSGVNVQSHSVKGGWLEFDTNEDYEVMLNMYKDGSLSELIDLGDC